MTRSTLAGWQHLTEFAVLSLAFTKPSRAMTGLGLIAAGVGLGGWLWWMLNPQPTEYHSCQCLTKRDREIMQKVGL